MRPKSIGVNVASTALRPAANAKIAGRNAEAEQRNPWGWLPALSLAGALGLLIVAAADRLSGLGVQGVEPLFWLGMLVIAAPITARLLAPRVTHLERLGLVLVFGVDLYLVKVLQSPFAFTYSDEFVHLYNANQIFDTSRLFSENPILAVSALYPGLESVTAALMRLAGLDVFTAGLVVIGTARVVMVLALFLLYEQLSGSARAASLASVLYAANSNFLFWSAQFSYESLALPLAILVLFVVARREAGGQAAERVGLTLVALMVTGAVVVTHHLSSYFLAVVLLLWTVLAWLARIAVFGRARRWLARLAATRLDPWLKAFVLWITGRPARPESGLGAATGGPGGLALFALVAASAWLVYAASLTLTYLPPVFGKATLALIKMMGGEATGRILFQSTSGSVSPAWERVVGISSVLLCLLGLPFGLRQVWRRYLHQPLILLLVGAALAYFGLLGLRFVPAAWEIGNRSSEFVFIGLALVLAVGRLPHWLPRPLLAAVLLTILAGGVIAGWSSHLRTAQVYRVVVGNQGLEPAGLTAARWARTYLGPGHSFAADEANGRLLLAYGDQKALTGRAQSVKSIFESDSLQDWQLGILQKAQIEYLAVDRRLISNDNMTGYFFDRGSHWPLSDAELLPPANYAKFDQLPQVTRIFDSGDLVLYDVRAWISNLAQP